MQAEGQQGQSGLGVGCDLTALTGDVSRSTGNGGRVPPVQGPEAKQGQICPRSKEVGLALGTCRPHSQPQLL